jgi:glucose/arabinose dehydrogenase
MTSRTTLSTIALAALLTGVGAAQTPAPAKPAVKHANAMTTPKPMHKVKEQKPGLLKQAKITPDAAEATALAQVPGGKVTAREIETEKGVLVYSFDVKETGKEGYQEVTVDATTGAVVSTMHESSKAEAKEKAALKHKPAKAKPDTTKKPT